MPNPPKQLRSITTEQNMLDAAEELLRNGDAQNVTVENVVRDAGATVGSFYARFGSVEGLFEALHTRYLTSLYESKIIEALNQSMEQPDLKSGLRHGCKILLEFAYEKRKLFAYFITHPSDDAVLIRRIGVESMHNNLKAHRSEVVHKDLKRASENTTRLIYQAVLGVVFLEPSEFIGRKTSLSSVIDTTTQMAYAYLTTE
ncbi:MAG: TetR/AcrR family transcriptional regulator [Acidimicrobiaceae bacterium]|jgi:AcrR family transcriptional regulator